jgi:hypothetical protein
MARLKNGMREFASHTYDRLYVWGSELIWLKDSPNIEHGEFLQCLAELGLKPRTAQNWMQFARECKEFERMVVPHWIRDRGKNATVALLASPEEPDEKKLKEKRPKHDSEPLNWSAAETAEKIFEIFEKLTQHRKLEEMEDVADQVAEKIREYIESRREEKLMIQHSGIERDLDLD